ncbi:hypothetical protein KC361_g9469 [Hortaea werneckii]|nr:hypothetical protein KC361_g9469 [Hortaea werneckii]
MQGEGGQLPLDDNFQSLIAPNSDPTTYIEDWNRVAMQKRTNRGRWDMLASMFECVRDFKAEIDGLTEMYQTMERKLQVTEQKLREANKQCDELNAQLANKDEQLRSLRREVGSYKNWLGAREQQINKIKDVVLTSADGCTGSTSEATYVESLGSLHGSSSANETDAGIHNAATPAKQDHRSTIDTGDSPAARTRKRAQRSGNSGPSKRRKTGDGEDDRIVVE